MEILLHFLSFLQGKVFKKSKIAQIYYCHHQSAGINLQSPQSDSTPWILTLPLSLFSQNQHFSLKKKQLMRFFFQILLSEKLSYTMMFFQLKSRCFWKIEKKLMGIFFFFFFFTIAAKLQKQEKGSFSLKFNLKCTQF